MDEQSRRASRLRSEAGGMGCVAEVKANKGAAGVDGQSVEDFEAGLKDNLYKLWNRMSSGCISRPR